MARPDGDGALRDGNAAAGRTLPAEAGARRPSVADPPDEHVAPLPGRVLIIADDVQLSRSMSQTLGRYYQVEHAASAGAGVARALVFVPDLVICELMLSAAAVLTLVENLRRHARLDRSAILVVVGAAEQDDLRTQLMRTGAQDFLSTPFSPEDLRVRVAGLIGRRRAEDRGSVLRAELTASELRGAADRRERDWLQNVIDQMSDGVVLSDAGGNITSQNRASRAMTSADGMLDIRRISGEGVPVLDLPSTQAMTQLAPVAEQELRLHKGGDVLPVVVSAVPIRDDQGAIAGAAMIIHDISAAKAIDAMREDWTAIVAHELRQPVNAIGVAAAVLRKSFGSSRPDAANHGNDVDRRTIDRICGLASRLTVMIGDLLDASAIETRRLSVALTPMKMADVIAGVLDGLGDVASLCHVTPDSSGAAEEPAWIDAGRIAQVLGNLISNALKFASPRGSRIDISTARCESGAGVRVTVENGNDGTGLNSDDLLRIFGRYERSSPTTAGLGLGLFICRGIIETHGGRIWADTIEGRTRFHFTVRTTRNGSAST